MVYAVAANTFSPPFGPVTLTVGNCVPADWVTVSVCPAICSVPVRAAPLLAATV